jgi:chorismate mutase/prephenate dehydratase
MELKDLRTSIDGIDSQIADLIMKRMEIAKEIAEYKKKNSLPVYDPQRERQKLSDIASRVGEENARITDALFSVIFDLSRSVQNRVVAGGSPIKDLIKDAIANTDARFPVRPLVACQGVEGAYSQIAAERIFPNGNIMYFNTFDKVFSAVGQGLCRYGILPLENSTAGSVSRIYDLMMEYEFYIVRSCRVKVDHCLLAKRGTTLDGIREIVSHEQALAQCQGFLKSLKNVKITACANTAEASKLVLDSGRDDIAAISSRSCAELYGLDCLAVSVQDKGSNFTRFICISKKLEIYPGANRTSLMLVLPNRCGSLYHVLSRFYALGINLIKLESRPLANSDFEFMFYFDLDTSVYSDEFLRVFDDLSGAVTSLKYLGSYSEVV